MSFFAEAQMPESYGPYQAFRQGLGFLPNLFRAQSQLPRVIEAEAAIAGAALVNEVALTRQQKESILLALAASHESAYCVTAHSWILRSLGVEEDRVGWIASDHHRAGLSPRDAALLDFGLKLGLRPTSIRRSDFETLRSHGFSDEHALEAVLIAALTNFLCTLAAGLGVTPDFEPTRTFSQRAAVESSGAAERDPTSHGRSPYLRAVELDPEAFPPFAFLRKSFGFVPNIFKAQTLRPDVLEAEALAVGSILLTDDVLARVHKEYILLVVSALNWNTYCVAVHCEMLRGLGIPEEESDQIALDHQSSNLPDGEKALLDFALKLAKRPAEFGLSDIEGLRRRGFTEHQALEAVVMTALTQFLNTLQMGLSPVTDFHPRLVFPVRQHEPARPPEESDSRKENLFSVPVRLSKEDPDASLVARVKTGDIDAFEELVRRHQMRVYRALLSIVGQPADAEDGTQSAFVKAFQHIGRFEGTSSFSTWLTRIAINEGVQLLRGRKGHESLEEEEAEEEFRPRQLNAWTEDPETSYAKTELRELVEREILRLPARYRSAIMLRDIEQLSTAEAAAALGLPVPTLKTRLLRGRLMLREALAGHFGRRPTRSPDVTRSPNV